MIALVEPAAAFAMSGMGFVAGVALGSMVRSAVNAVGNRRGVQADD